MEQAKDYEQYVKSSDWNKVLEALALMNEDHPFLAVRAASITQWCSERKFQEITGRVPAAPEKTCCPQCGLEVEGDWAFCNKCGARLPRND